LLCGIAAVQPPPFSGRRKFNNIVRLKSFLEYPPHVRLNVARQLAKIVGIALHASHNSRLRVSRNGFTKMNRLADQCFKLVAE
jgi:hypothetical protein